MMDLFGIDNHTNMNASIQDLANELSQGHGVVVSVRSDQLWEQGPLMDLWNWFKEQFGFDTPDWSPADHAVSVTGLQMADDGSAMVILNDPGDPLGAGHAYPLDRFMDAWENSHFQMTATSDVLPSLAGDTGGSLLASLANGVSDWLGDHPVVAEIGGLAIGAYLGYTNPAMGFEIGVEAIRAYLENEDLALSL